MESDYQIVELIQESVDNLWQLRYDFGMQYKKPSDASDANWQEYKDRVCQRLNKDQNYRNCLILKQQELWATFTVQLRGDEEKELLIVLSFGEMNPDQELLTEVLNYLKSLYRDECSLFIYANRHFNTEIRSCFKLRIKSEVESFLLKKEKFNIASCNTFLYNQELSHRHITIKYFSEIPDTMLNEYANVLNEVSNDMVKNEIAYIYNFTAADIQKTQLEDRRNGDLGFRTLAFNSKNQIIGISSLWLKYGSSYPYQLMTGVKNEYRGQNIGIWLKTVLYRKVFIEMPNIKGVVTEMRSNNKYIQDINTLIGYGKIGERGEYVVNKEDFTQWRKNEIL